MAVLICRIDRIFLIPEQAPFDIHVLERECILGAEQSWQIPGHNRNIGSGSNLQIGDRQNTAKRVYGNCSMERRRYPPPECHNRPPASSIE